jgi:CIC family chloride channel protein
MDRMHSTAGFDTPPNRRPSVTLLLFLVVVALSVSIAAGFRELGLRLVGWYGSSRDATRAAAHLPGAVTFTIVAGSVLAAAWLGRIAARRWPRQAGLEAIAATASGEDRRISMRATLLRSTGTWLMLSGMAPVGREAAILETGGAIGSTLGRRFGGRGAALAAAGAVAAFATAYHAPLAAIVYIEEHLRVRGSRRGALFTVAGALVGFLLATQVYGVDVILPEVNSSWTHLVVAGAVAVVPATLAARLLLEVRNRLSDAREQHVTRPGVRVLVVMLAAAVAGAVVTRYPLAAGNGMDSLRRVAPAVAVVAAVSVAMAVAKSIGSTAIISSGGPGGAMTPTIVVGGGAAMLAVLAGHAFGWGTPDVWALVVLAGSVAVAVGLRAPLTAVLLLPELTGRYALVPATAAVVLCAVVLDRGLDWASQRLVERLPARVRDEDG